MYPQGCCVYYAGAAQPPRKFHLLSERGKSLRCVISWQVWSVDVKNLDALLAGVRDLPAPSRLASLDRAVLAELDRRKAAPMVGPATFALAVSMALLLGIAGAALPATPAVASPPLSPFDARLMFAPSTLLSAE